MCRMFPELLSREEKKEISSSAEIKLYEVFKNSLDDKWTVFYNVAWLGKALGDEPEDGEADFIIAHPDKGILIIEVKGGGIKYDGNCKKWYSIDKNQVEHQIKNPFDQAKKSKYALLNKIKSFREMER